MTQESQLVSRVDGAVMANRRVVVKDDRELRDLISIGPAMLRDFELLGIGTIAELARQDPRALYERLCRKTGTRQDPCVLDVFNAAVAQARDPKLPLEQCQWWWWSRVRKAKAAPSEQSMQR